MVNAVQIIRHDDLTNYVFVISSHVCDVNHGDPCRLCSARKKQMQNWYIFYSGG